MMEMLVQNEIHHTHGESPRGDLVVRSLWWGPALPVWGSGGGFSDLRSASPLGGAFGGFSTAALPLAALEIEGDAMDGAAAGADMQPEPYEITLLVKAEARPGTQSKSVLLTSTSP
jgi:hypothetical protein